MIDSNNLIEILLSEELLEPILLSLKISMASLFLHLIFGILFAYILERKRSVFTNILDILITIPMVFPPIATGFFLLLILGKDSLFSSIFSLDIIFSFYGVLFASFLAGLPLIVKSVQSGIRVVSKEYSEAAYMLGKNEPETFFFVIIPNIKTSICAGLTLCFARSLGEVGITMMLGGNIVGKTETISLAIFNAVFDGEFDLAIILSIILAIISTSIFLILRKLEVL